VATPSPGNDPKASFTDDLLQAAELARASGGKGSVVKDTQIIRFAAGDRPFAAPIEAVERLERVPTVTPVPRTPGWLHGVASLRGGIVCIVDLRRLLAHDEAGTPNPRSLVILHDGARRRLGVLSSSLPDFERIRVDESVRPPAAEVDVYHGAVERDYELVGILDPMKLFDHVERSLGDGA